MTFIKLLRFDLKNGIICKWRDFLKTAILFFIAAGLHFLTLRIFEITRPEYFSVSPTVGDYCLSIFAGSQIDAIQTMGSSFHIPFAWLFYVFWMLYVLLRYPLENLNSMGKHLLVLSRSRTAWWFSKCIWICIGTFFHFVSALAGIITMALLCGAKANFTINSYCPVIFGFFSGNIKDGPWSLIPFLRCSLFVLIALGILQLTLSLFLKPLYSYLMVIAYLLASLYFRGPLFLGNFLMGARSDVFVTSGYSAFYGTLLALFAGVIAVIWGLLKFQTYDILNRE